MSIDSIKNTNISLSSLSNYKSGVDTSATVQEVDKAPKIEVPKLQDTKLLSAQLEENVYDSKEEHREQLDNAIEKLNKTAKLFNRSLKFTVHEATNRTMISVIDTDTDKVIREIPEEKVLDMVAKMQECLGIIFDKEA